MRTFKSLVPAFLLTALFIAGPAQAQSYRLGVETMRDPSGVRVVGIIPGSLAVGNLFISDVITAVDGIRVYDPILVRSMIMDPSRNNVSLDVVDFRGRSFRVDVEFSVTTFAAVKSHGDGRVPVKADQKTKTIKKITRTPSR
ncbi:MAG: hypothetical protein EBV06_00570 [Planctomycetia bacterium]|nr:hypothetical protein [Planctomycetia bacterium]